LPDECVVLGLSVTPEELLAKTAIGAHGVTVTLPYLNAASEHGQIAKLSVLADGDTEPTKVSGSGPGWSIRHQPVEGRRSSLFETLISFAGLAYTLLAIFWYIPFVSHRYGIGDWEVSWRTVAAGVPILLPAVAIAIVTVRWTTRDLRRAKREDW
jgi:hypothetical protein